MPTPKKRPGPGWLPALFRVDAVDWRRRAAEMAGAAWALASRLRPALYRIPWRSYAPILLLGALGSTATLLALGKVTELEQQRFQSAFDEASRDRVLVIQREVEHALSVVRDIGSFFDASQYVGRRQFREFVGPALKHNPSIASLEWAPRVPDRQRDSFLAQARRSFPRFRILEYGKEGEPQDAVRRPEHFPVLYVQPYRRNKTALGLDLASMPAERTVLSRAVEAGRMEASLPLALAGDEGPEAGFAVYLPVYERPEGADGDEVEDLETSTAEPLHDQLRGFVIGRFETSEIIERALRNLGPSGVNLSFSTKDGQGRATQLYSHGSRLRDHNETSPKSRVYIKENRDTIKVANRQWDVVCTPVRGQFEPDGWGGGVVLVGGAAFTILSMFYLFTLIGQKEQIKRLVAQRTLELERSNVALNNEVTERRRAEIALQVLNATLEQRVARRTAEAERRAQDLEQFAYVASHDLKAPLRAVSNLAAWLTDDLQSKLTPEAKEQLDLLRDRVARMHSLIEGLLAYSRIGRTPGSIEEVDTGALVADTIDSLAPPTGFRVEVGRNMPRLRTDRLHLGQVFANLISNSIKHHHLKRGRIRVAGHDLNGHCEFEVADDGPGIAPEYHEKIFMMFQTLNVKDYGGDTGIGLALVKKLVEEHGGSISLDSAPGKGSRFRFSWAKEASESSEPPSPLNTRVETKKGEDWK